MSQMAPKSHATGNDPEAKGLKNEDDISILDMAIIIAKHRKLILGLPIVVAVTAAAVALLLPNIYTATTKILTPQGQSTSAALLAQFSGLANLAGGIKTPNDLYIGMLKSRTVADKLIERFDLNVVYKESYQSNTRKELENQTTITSGKDGIITIETDDRDPKRAAELANAYVEELFKLTQVLAVTEASQRRLFLERQFEIARDNLAKAEVDARQAINNGGLVQVESQGRAILETTARLRGQMTAKEVQIGSMRAFATDRNPNLKLAQQELESMKHELSRIEGSVGGKYSFEYQRDKSGIDSVGLLRNVKYRETVYELLAKQYELAKIDEAKDSAVVQVMDKGVEPDRKSKPKRALIVVLATATALFFAIVGAFVREFLNIAQTEPYRANRLRELKRYLAWKNR